MSHQSHFPPDRVDKKHVHPDASGSATASGPCTPGAGAGTADVPMGKGLQQALLQGLMWAQQMLCVHSRSSASPKSTDRVIKLFKVV